MLIIDQYLLETRSTTYRTFLWYNRRVPRTCSIKFHIPLGWRNHDWNDPYRLCTLHMSAPLLDKSPSWFGYRSHFRPCLHKTGIEFLQILRKRRNAGKPVVNSTLVIGSVIKKNRLIFPLFPWRIIGWESGFSAERLVNVYPLSASNNYPTHRYSKGWFEYGQVLAAYRSYSSLTQV